MTRQERFGKRLRQLRREKSAREERDVDQTEVAKAIGDRQSNVAKWEKGRLPKDDEIIRRLAAYYRVSYTWLHTGDGQRSTDPLDAPAEPDIEIETDVTLDDAPAEPTVRRVVGARRGRK